MTRPIPLVTSIYKKLYDTADRLWQSGNYAESNRYLERAARFNPADINRAKAQLGARAI